MNIQPHEIILRLVSEFGYSEKNATRIAHNLQACTPTIQEAFEKWWHGEGLDTQLEVQGYTLKRLIEEHGLMNIPADEIIPRLVAEFGYPEKNAASVAHNLQACTPVIQETFEKWWSGEGLDPQLEVKGYTLKRLIEEYGFTPIAAFLDMDWLIREPEKAAQALSEGYDTIE
jgi:hypothetical protein